MKTNVQENVLTVLYISKHEQPLQHKDLAMFNNKDERFIQIICWLQLVGIVTITSLYFASFLVFFCLMALGMIFFYYAFNAFMPAKYIPVGLTIGWIVSISLWGVSIALYFQTSLIVIILIALAGLVSYNLNRSLIRDWGGK